MGSDALKYYIQDPTDPENNFNLAVAYFDIGQTASAVSFFLRCADRTEDLNLAYECLIHMGECFDSQGNRLEHVMCMYKHAISICPNRPEAYYLLANFENWHKKYSDAYCHTIQGLNCDLDHPEFRVKTRYLGRVSLLYEKVVASWHWGKNEEHTLGLKELVADYWDELDDLHQEKVIEMMQRAGVEKKMETAVWHDPIPYTKEKYDNLRYKFSGSEDLDHNYAQVYQDLFVLSMLDGKRGGCFLEIGGARPYFGNNTALLEESFNWTGVSIEYNQQFAQEYTEARKNTTMLCTDATAVDYDNILSSAYRDNVIDYLQLDIDPPDKTYEVLLKIPFDKYKFKTITYEHDYYSDSSKSYREKSREYLESKGYVLVVDNISPDENSPFEDWWVHPDFISPYIIDRMKLVDGKTKYVEDYMFPGKSTVTENDIFRLAVKSDTVWVVDNFYENPDEVRKFALEQDYHIGGIGRGYIGNRTHQQFLFPGLKERFEQIMGKKITKWKEHGMNGRFQYCWSGQPVVYHCDSQKWGGVLYLTPGAPFECGTTLHAHKKTRARNYKEDGWDASWSPDIPGDPHLDGTPFEPVDVLGNVYNRLIIFDASSIHSASEYFGTVKENCRLWQMFFFDT
jgi:tetratricopeptide (TPR) repeat protein